MYVCARVRAVDSVVSLCNPMDLRPPSSFIHGISQARILEWLAISSSRGSLFHLSLWKIFSLNLGFRIGKFLSASE